MSKELQQFYNELWTWIQAGCPHHDVFEWSYGICGNLERWTVDFDEDTWRSLKSELSFQFKINELNPIYPFGEKDYDRRCNEELSMYECPKRLKWIEDHISK